MGLYSWRLPARLVSAFLALGGSLWGYLRWFHSQKSLDLPPGAVDQRDTQQTRLLQLIVLLWLVAVVACFLQWAFGKKAGFWAFGLSLWLAYPVVLAYGFALGVAVARFARLLIRPKKLFRAVLSSILEWQVTRLRKHHTFRVVAVAGSVGKTTTKLAIAELLGQNLRVQYQKGNYNDRVTVPLILFDHTLPNLFNIFAWAKIVGANQSMITAPYPYDVVVVELGTDAPGQMAEFAYLRPDITVLTSVTPEHMVNFGVLKAVAEEELQVFAYSKSVVANTDDVPAEFLLGRKYLSYGVGGKPDYAISHKAMPALAGQTVTVTHGRRKISGQSNLLGVQGAKASGVAMAVADMLGLDAKAIGESARAIRNVPGRMQVLPGVKGSILLDDTYNATPIAVQAALDVVYATKAPQKIAILGSMNELGDYTKEAHQIVGSYCNPKHLDLVITVGDDAMRWLAPAARAQGCVVHTCQSPYSAGKYALERLQKGALVLAKGSQNGVFTEEALKKLLLHPADAEKLVRQTAGWRRIKARQFKDL